MKGRIKYKISVAHGDISRIAKELGVSPVFVARALRYDSETSKSQIRIRDMALKDCGGKVVKVIL